MGLVFRCCQSLWIGFWHCQWSSWTRVHCNLQQIRMPLFCIMFCCSQLNRYLEHQHLNFEIINLNSSCILYSTTIFCIVIGLWSYSWVPLQCREMFRRLSSVSGVVVQQSMIYLKEKKGWELYVQFVGRLPIRIQKW